MNGTYDPSPFHLFSKWGDNDSIYPKGYLRNLGDSPPLNFYRSWKPYLHSAGFYDFILGKESYYEFQKKISSLAEEPFGVSLALACMVEVNVAGGILNASRYKEPGSHFLWNAFFGKNPILILAVGVSEPGFDGKLKKLQSGIDENQLTGIKSFITNGGEADFIFWVTKKEEVYPLYFVSIPKESDHPNLIEKRIFYTDFTPQVSHLHIQFSGLPIPEENLLLANYGSLGLELRLKELCSLVSLLIGKTKPLSERDKGIKGERDRLVDWQERFLRGLVGNPTTEPLLETVPYPISPLISAVTKHFGLETGEDLKSIDPDWQLFLWEDSLTKYLVQKKKRTTTNQMDRKS
ncbi:acyl-CoA dehydrogenase [Leptospira jelokensis]|uniref:acyl-CoA dehydrogenase n=1 Tax=Leptospira jelokensis TaxID=2484931 RepID=UPI00109108C1|nr:acyl-CoA dehydrogenase [Leptospira jelokensis]TGL99387.1 acyl-CoA dehydrogenase [Leptospira jelokensis]